MCVVCVVCVGGGCTCVGVHGYKCTCVGECVRVGCAKKWCARTSN